VLLELARVLAEAIGIGPLLALKTLPGWRHWLAAMA
jgi:hypothetical protein